MREVYDMTEKASLPYVLLGETARQLYDGVDGFNENQLDVQKIEIGVSRRQMTPEVLSLFHTWDIRQWEDKGFMYTHQGIPIYVRVLERRYKFFEVPDMRFYGADMFKIPNPFDNYWRARFIVR